MTSDPAKQAGNRTYGIKLDDAQMYYRFTSKGKEFKKMSFFLHFAENKSYGVI